MNLILQDPDEFFSPKYPDVLFCLKCLNKRERKGREKSLKNWREKKKIEISGFNFGAKNINWKLDLDL